MSEETHDESSSVATSACTPVGGVHPGRAILTLNGGSSSIKFALFEEALPKPRRLLGGQVERIGAPGTVLSATDAAGKPLDQRTINASTHEAAAATLIDWIGNHAGLDDLAGIGHRVVHGGAKLLDHRLITPPVIDELRRTQPLDLAHLPRELATIEAFIARFPSTPHFACFDTAFHRDLPPVARRLPIPRRYDAAGVRRFGFHGLSFAYLMEELSRLAGPQAARGRVILAHLGAGASMAAVRDGKSIDTTMAFTPTAGLVMATRPGDMDGGLLVHLMRLENMTPDRMDDLLNRECGLLGVSETSADMRDLIARRGADPRAAEAVDLFCYSARKWIGALAAALGGVDTLIFAGGIGEHSAIARAGMCAGLEFLGVKLDASANERNAALISTADSPAAVRVIKTDEEVMIAKIVLGLLKG